MVLDAVVLNNVVVVACPSVTVPAFKFVLYKLVLLAVVEKKLVVVPAVMERLRSVVSPVFDIEKREDVAEAVEDATSNRREFVSPLFACTANLAKGDVVPIPTLPVAC